LGLGCNSRTLTAGMGGLLAKPETTKHTEDGSGKRLSFGVSAMQGWRKAMEDAHLALPDFDSDRQLSLFGVFDGHGGSAVAAAAAEKLPEILRSLPAFQEGRYQEALHESFLRLDEFLDGKAGRKRIEEIVAEEPKASSESEEDAEAELLRQQLEKDIDGEGEEEEEEVDLVESGQEDSEEDAEFEMDEAEGEEEEIDANNAWASGEGPDGMGTTAVVALIVGGDSPTVICANAGDSRCVLARGTRALNMSRDHKPMLKCERERIRKAGGFVTAEGRVDGNLNLSRALGDFAYKKDKTLKPTEQKISCEAEVKKRGLVAQDRYLLLGCDGIFEKATSQALVDFMLPKLAAQDDKEELSDSCSAFLDHNIAKVPAQEQGLGCDNMTLMVVLLPGGAAESQSDNGKPARKSISSLRRLPANSKRRSPMVGMARRRLVMRRNKRRACKASSSKS